MNFDPTNEAHRSALFNACALTPEERDHYLAHMGDDDGLCVQFCRALSLPEQSAAIIIALLDATGRDSAVAALGSCQDGQSFGPTRPPPPPPPPGVVAEPLVGTWCDALASAEHGRCMLQRGHASDEHEDSYGNRWRSE